MREISTGVARQVRQIETSTEGQRIGWLFGDFKVFEDVLFCCYPRIGVITREVL